MDVFKLSQREASQFGGSVAAAFSHCMLAGNKAVTGVKLHKDVVEVYNASLGGCKMYEIVEVYNKGYKNPKYMNFLLI